MFAVPSRNACAGRFGSRCRTAIAALLLAAGVTGAAGNVLAGAAPEPVCQDHDPSCGNALALDQLSGTIDGLKASLSAIRQDLETRRGEADQPARAIEELCAAPLAEAHAARDAAMSALEQFRATFESERAAARDAAAATGDELSAVRERLAAAEAQAAQLRDERAALTSRIDELDAAVEKARTSEVVAALVEPRRGAPIDGAQAAELEAAPERQLMLPVAAQPGPPSFAPARSATGAGGPRPAPPVDRLQLQAELALAQLKIAELTTALQSARLHQEQVEAEVSTLRSLTDAKIRQLMGWQ
jgi:hypothetical protein